jgi:antitoxin YefM
MFTAIKKNYVIGKEGKFEVQSELPEGTKIEVIILVEDQDETSYLLSTEANRQHLMEAISNIEQGENLVVISPADASAVLISD